MTDIFISYAREDRDQAAALAEVFARAGHVVWWDRELTGGGDFASEIALHLEDADVVVVLWSRESVKSEFVRDESSRARDRGVLLPVRIEAVSLPLGFGTLHTLDLLDWDGNAEAAEVDDLLDQIAKLRRRAGMPGGEYGAAETPSNGGRDNPSRFPPSGLDANGSDTASGSFNRRRQRRRVLQGSALAALVLLGGGGTLGWRQWVKARELQVSEILRKGLDLQFNRQPPDLVTARSFYQDAITVDEDAAAAYYYRALTYLQQLAADEASSTPATRTALLEGAAEDFRIANGFGPRLNGYQRGVIADQLRMITARLDEAQPVPRSLEGAPDPIVAAAEAVALQPEQITEDAPPAAGGSSSQPAAGGSSALPAAGGSGSTPPPATQGAGSSDTGGAGRPGAVPAPQDAVDSTLPAPVVVAAAPGGDGLAADDVVPPTGAASAGAPAPPTAPSAAPPPAPPPTPSTVTAPAPAPAPARAVVVDDKLMWNTLARVAPPGNIVADAKMLASRIVKPQSAEDLALTRSTLKLSPGLAADVLPAILRDIGASLQRGEPLSSDGIQAMVDLAQQASPATLIKLAPQLDAVAAGLRSTGQTPEARKLLATLAQAKSQASAKAPIAWIQIANERQRPLAEQLVARMRESGYAAPAIENTGERRAPDRPEVRAHGGSDPGLARWCAAAMQDVIGRDASVVTLTNARAELDTFELWFDRSLCEPDGRSVAGCAARG